MYDEYDDDEEFGASLGRKVALGLGVVAIAAAGFFAFKAVTKSDGGEAVGDATSSSTTTSAPAVPGASTGSSTPGSAASDDTAAPASSAPAVTTTVPATSTPTSTPTSTTAATTTTAASAATTTAPAPVPTTTAPAPPPPATYAMQPDGSPAWVIATYGPNSITIQGAVPDAAARDKLQALAVANAKPGQADTVDNQLTVNPAVPPNVGVRIIELTSERFPEGSAEVSLLQAAELDRVGNVMTALPNITALIIGHADQRGDEGSNYLISAARAEAVRNYLIGRGVAADRLSSRAVGEADLLTINDDDTALALNRRTEFVLFGLLQA